jgi:hypothetical protein
MIECSSGKPECLETGNADNGSSCGPGMVCKDGACGTCADGDACVPMANPCHEGTLSCAGGNVTCTDAMKNRPAGTGCGADKVCSATGECVACQADMPCEVAGQPCKLGKIECTTGAPVCAIAGDAEAGKACGMNQVCSQGSCGGRSPAARPAPGSVRAGAP